MIIYGSLVSPFVRKLIGYCGEKGLEFEIKGVGIADPDPDFRAASPLGKMPAIKDGDFGLTNSVSWAPSMIRASTSRPS